MKAKRIAAALCAAAIFAAVACVPAVKPQVTPEPSAETTADPMAAPAPTTTAAPPSKPTASPAPGGVAPSDLGELPSFPGIVKTGNLIGGALFDEPGKYFVLNGESDLHYVYDRFGEFVTTFSAVDTGVYCNWSSYPGIYGEHGAPYGYSIERGEMLPNYQIFDDIAINTENYYYDEDGDWIDSIFVTDISSSMLEDLNLLDDAPEYRVYYLDEYGMECEKTIKGYKIGYAGGVLHIDGRYIVFEATFSFDFDTEEHYRDYGECRVFNEEGKLTGTLDLSVFGNVLGVFGGKYIIGEHRLDESEWIEDPVYGTVTTETNLYTLSGELVMKNIVVHDILSEFFPAGEIYMGILIAASCIKDENGNFYDAELNRIDEYEPLLRNPNADRYLVINDDERTVVSSGMDSSTGIYAGIKDKDGNWLFRIYDPRGASDSKNEAHTDR